MILQTVAFLGGVNMLHGQYKSLKEPPRGITIKDSCWAEQSKNFSQERDDKFQSVFDLFLQVPEKMNRGLTFIFDLFNENGI